MKTAIEYFKENFDQSAAEKLLDFALNGYASEQTLRILEKGLVAFCDTENDAYAAALYCLLAATVAHPRIFCHSVARRLLNEQEGVFDAYNTWLDEGSIVWQSWSFSKFLVAYPYLVTLASITEDEENIGTTSFQKYEETTIEDEYEEWQNFAERIGELSCRLDSIAARLAKGVGQDEEENGAFIATDEGGAFLATDEDGAFLATDEDGEEEVWYWLDDDEGGNEEDDE